MRALIVVALVFPAAVLSEVLWKDVCTQDDVKGLPFCNMTLDIPKRAADYVSRLTTDEKIPIMTNEASAVAKLHIPPYQWGSEGLHGPLQPCVCDANKVCKCPTSFPMPSALGCAFNDSLVRSIGRVIGREARAINNLRNHVTQNKYGDGIDYWSPTINMQRDPRWGRNMEVLRERVCVDCQDAAFLIRCFAYAGSW
jgi:beta-glucosidase-like glycosyl hydrolase